MVKLCICIFVYNLYVHMFSYSLMYVNVCVWVGIHVCARVNNISGLHIPFFILPLKCNLVGGWFLICGLWGILFVSEFLPFYKGHSMSNYRRKFTTILHKRFCFSNKKVFLLIHSVFSQKLKSGSYFFFYLNTFSSLIRDRTTKIPRFIHWLIFWMYHFLKTKLTT